MDKIRVLIADDHPIVREGIKSLIENKENILVVGEAANGLEVIQKVEILSPDIVLMDISMPIMGGIEATKQLRTLNPNIKVLILSMYNDREHILQTIRAGAKGYILKIASSNELLSAIQNIISGQAYFSQEISQVVLNDYITKEEQINKKKKIELTEREEEVLIYITKGLTNKEIAKILKISWRTVETHKEHIKQKLNAESKADMIRYAVKNNLL